LIMWEAMTPGNVLPLSKELLTSPTLQAKH